VKPRQVAYPSHDIRFKHYGTIIEQMIKEISSMEEGPMKDQVVLNLANFMKMLYVNWNKDSVADEVIFEHLKVLSKGKLRVKEDTRLQQPVEIPNKSVTKKSPARQQRSRARMPNNGNGKNFRKG
jgi:hypothetical protein